MVENIYGRKTYPQSKYQERSFLQSYAFTVHHVRRVSGEPPNLRTIAETEDDDLPTQSAGPSVHNDSGATGSSDRKPRAISLPTIYRDGSYLRINFPTQFNNEGSGRRRFSEPAVSWSSKFRPAIVPVSNDKRTNERAAHLVRTQKISLYSGRTTYQQAIQIEKRRHSDPLIYSSENTPKIECSDTDCSKNTHHLKSRNSVRTSSTSFADISQDVDKPESKQPENTTSSSIPTASTRRRKSSLVPIPFSIVKSSRKQKMPSKRRLSFPPSKSEEELTKNLPALYKHAWIESNVDDQYGSSSESLTPLDLLIRKDSSGEPIDILDQDYSAEKKNSCEEIITQWMKFFG